MRAALMFPGQGCQYIGMCKSLIKKSDKARQIFRAANDVLSFNLVKMVLEGNIRELMLTKHAQPAVVTASYAFYHAYLETTESEPVCAIGHSLGEISALIAAGTIDFEDGVNFAAQRGSIMQEAAAEKNGCAGVVLDVDINTVQAIVKDICQRDYAAITGYNSPKQFLVAGTHKAISELEERVDEAGGDYIAFRMIPMKEGAPYHSELISFIVPSMEDIIGRMTFKDPKFDIISTVTGSLIEVDELPKVLAMQLLKPVIWSQALEKVAVLKPDCIIDIGPQQIMRNLVQETLKVPKALAFDDDDDRKNIEKMAKRFLMKEATA